MYYNTIKEIFLIPEADSSYCKEVPCGNNCSILLNDAPIINQGTITNSEQADLIRPINFINIKPPIVKISINPKNPNDLPELLSGLIN